MSEELLRSIAIETNLCDCPNCMAGYRRAYEAGRKAKKDEIIEWLRSGIDRYDHDPDVCTSLSYTLEYRDD